MIAIGCAGACSASKLAADEETNKAEHNNNLAADEETNKAEATKKFDWKKNNAELRKIANSTQGKKIS